MRNYKDLIDEIWSQIDSATVEMDRVVDGTGDEQSLSYVVERCREAVTLFEQHEAEVEWEKRNKANSKPTILRLVNRS